MGDTSYDVYLGLVKVASVTVYGLQCPISKGPASISYDVKLASILPPAFGTSSFHFTAKDQKGTDIICLQATLAVNLLESAPASADQPDPSMGLAAAILAPRYQVQVPHSTLGMPVGFSAKDCGASSGPSQSSEAVPATPKTGEIFKVTNHFSFDEDISGGSFDVKVHALGALQLKHATGPLCGSDTSYDVYLGLVKVASVTVYGSQCPIAKGPASMSYDVKLSPILPPALGDASFHLTAKDQKGTDIVCVQANLAINLENSHETKNAEIAAKSVEAGSDLSFYADPRLTAAQFAPSFGMPVHFGAKDCGASSGHYQSSAVVPARPKTGEVFKVTNHFSYDEDITGGSFDVKVHALGGIQLKHATGPLCG